MIYYAVKMIMVKIDVVAHGVCGDMVETVPFNTMANNMTGMMPVFKTLEDAKNAFPGYEYMALEAVNG